MRFRRGNMIKKLGLTGLALLGITGFLAKDTVLAKLSKYTYPSAFEVLASKERIHSTGADTLKVSDVPDFKYDAAKTFLKMAHVLTAKKLPETHAETCVDYSSLTYGNYLSLLETNNRKDLWNYVRVAHGTTVSITGSGRHTWLQLRDLNRWLNFESSLDHVGSNANITGNAIDLERISPDYLLINALGTRFRPVEFWKKERPAEINLGKWDKQSLGELLSEAQNIEDVGERIHFLSGQFKEARYKGGTMVGSNWELEPEILVANLQSLDCFTFVDYVHAMSKSFDYDSFIDNLKATRYGDGEVSFSKRNHYFTQWIERNNLDDITSELEGTQVTTKTINRLTFIDTLGHKTHAHYLPSLDHNGFSYLERDVWYVPQKEIKSNVLSDLKPGDFVGLYSSAESIDVEHLGIITKKPNGKTYIRHASSAAGRVIDSELVSYVNRVKLFEGIVVARAKD